jgi:hypothetical protein
LKTRRQRRPKEIQPARISTTTTLFISIHLYQ